LYLHVARQDIGFINHLCERQIQFHHQFFKLSVLVCALIQLFFHRLLFRLGLLPLAIKRIFLKGLKYQFEGKSHGYTYIKIITEWIVRGSKLDFLVRTAGCANRASNGILNFDAIVSLRRRAHDPLVGVALSLHHGIAHVVPIAS
jgi:hypothetical protein